MPAAKHPAGALAPSSASPYPVRRESNRYGHAVRPRTHPARLAPRAVGALSVVQTVVLAGQLMVVPENSTCLVNLHRRSSRALLLVRV